MCCISVFLIVKCVLGKLLVLFWCNWCMWLSVWKVMINGRCNCVDVVSDVRFDMKKLVWMML